MWATQKVGGVKALLGVRLLSVNPKWTFSNYCSGSPHYKLSWKSVQMDRQWRYSC